MRRKVFRNEHPMIVTALGNVARMLLESGEASAAREHAAEGAAMADRIYTEPNRFHPSIHSTLAAAQLAVGDAAGARQSVRRARQLLATLGSAAPSSVVRWVEQVRASVCAPDPAECAAD